PAPGAFGPGEAGARRGPAHPAPVRRHGAERPRARVHLRGAVPLKAGRNGRGTRGGSLPLLPSGPGGIHVPALPRPQTCPAITPQQHPTERVGFEPTIRVNVYTLSKRAPSAARPPLQPPT